ncbi:spore coat protein [Oceanobacillus sp. Castelsardo]|uniref:spore coat protein n=1 Tax=Oceanobacillus sp. Castelsardo TaxID=1851204 RepID=UPI0008396FA2|nr:spore coat protein [Oceanobacillus sp. Castelsardo]
MSDSSKDFQMPQKVVEVMIDNILRKNDIQKEEIKKNVSDEQKVMIKEMIEDLKKQVEQFNESKNKTIE